MCWQPTNDIVGIIPPPATVSIMPMSTDILLILFPSMKYRFPSGSDVIAWKVFFVNCFVITKYSPVVFSLPLDRPVLPPQLCSHLHTRLHLALPSKQHKVFQYQQSAKSRWSCLHLCQFGWFSFQGVGWGKGRYWTCHSWGSTQPQSHLW